MLLRCSLLCVQCSSSCDPFSLCVARPTAGRHRPPSGGVGASRSRSPWRSPAHASGICKTWIRIFSQRIRPPTVVPRRAPQLTHGETPFTACKGRVGSRARESEGEAQGAALSRTHAPELESSQWNSRAPAAAFECALTRSWPVGVCLCAAAAVSPLSCTHPPSRACSDREIVSLCLLWSPTDRRSRRVLCACVRCGVCLAVAGPRLGHLQDMDSHLQSTYPPPHSGPAEGPATYARRNAFHRV